MSEDQKPIFYPTKQDDLRQYATQAVAHCDQLLDTLRIPWTGAENYPIEIVRGLNALRAARAHFANLQRGIEGGSS